MTQEEIAASLQQIREQRVERIRKLQEQSKPPPKQAEAPEA